MRALLASMLMVCTSASAQITCKTQSSDNDQRRSPATLAICTTPELSAQNDALKALQARVIQLGGDNRSKAIDHLSKYRTALIRCKDGTCVNTLQTERKDFLEGLLANKEGRRAIAIQDEAERSDDMLFKALAARSGGRRLEMLQYYKTMLAELQLLRELGGSAKIEGEQREWAARKLEECTDPRSFCEARSFEDRLQSLASDVGALKRRQIEEKSLATAERLECRFSFSGKSYTNGLRLNADGTALLTEYDGNPSLTVQYYGKHTSTGNQLAVTLSRIELSSTDSRTQLQLDGNLPGDALNDGRLDALMNEHRLLLSRSGKILQGTYVYDHKKKGRRELPMQCSPQKAQP